MGSLRYNEFDRGLLSQLSFRNSFESVMAYRLNVPCSICRFEALIFLYSLLAKFMYLRQLKNFYFGTT